MNFSQALRLAKTKVWTTASAPAVYQYCQPFIQGFSLMKRYYKNTHDFVFLTLDNTYGCQLTKEQNNFKIIKELYQDHKKSKVVIKMWEKLRNSFYIYCQGINNLKDFSDKKLFEKYQEFFNLFVELWAPALSVDVMGTYTETELLNKFFAYTDSKDISKNIAASYFTELCRPAYNSFLLQEHASVLKLSLSYKHKENDFEERLKKHQQNYFWVENSYRDIKVLNENYFLEKVKEESNKTISQIDKELKEVTDLNKIKQRHTELFKKLNLPEELKQDLLITQLFAEWQDKRKSDNLYGNHFLNLFLKEFATRKKLTLREVEFCTVSELKEAFLNSKELPKDVLKSRIKEFVQISDYVNNIDVIFHGKEARQLLDVLHPKSQGDNLAGFVASSGVGKQKIIQGIARVVFDPDMDKVKDGEILIAAMTRPEYVPLMKKAKAVITDEGGVTSHAAIVSRELGIPCVIGTKIATKIFKTGDVIVIDLEKGEVKKED